MNVVVFLLLFAVFFVLVAVVVWVVRDSHKAVSAEAEAEAEEPHQLPDEPDEMMAWLEELARKQEQAGTKRLH